jgi:hypothetical protein
MQKSLSYPRPPNMSESWQLAVAGLKPWDARSLARTITVEAVWEMLSDANCFLGAATGDAERLRVSPFEKLWVKPATPEDPVAFWAARVARKPQMRYRDTGPVLVTQANMSDSTHGLVLYELLPEALGFVPNQKCELFEVLGEASEEALRGLYGQSLLYWID